MRQGDRVKIIKPGHPARGGAGVVLGLDDIDGAPCAYVAGVDPHDGKVWPVFVIRLRYLELIARPDTATSRRLVESIIDQCEARGCPLRGVYAWAGPYRPEHKITG